MSRSKSKARRDNNTIANQQLPRRSIYSSSVTNSAKRKDLRSYEDRRRYTPDTPSPARSFSGGRQGLRALPNRNWPAGRPNQGGVPYTGHMRSLWDQVPVRIGFERPQSMVICTRRQIRREVLHASGKAGKKGQKRPVYGPYSHISCRKKR